MTTLISFVLRVLLLVAGLASAAVIALGAVVVLAIWAMRATWSRLTGRPTKPFVFRVNPRQGFDRMYRGAGQSGQGSRTPRADSVPTARKIPDVTDVEPKPR
ncbi:hypothetical protein [Caenimonas sp. SL110]|uniref:hypothetical protein n=1 Tax=Caenimonas sp. SL110 TaxID=1450524 RepID=UPI0006530379|nr:hypothetical protein [Caenimonas sp. SL110]